MSLLFYDDYKAKTNDYLALDDYIIDDYECMPVICVFNSFVLLKVGLLSSETNGKYGKIVTGKDIYKSLLVKTIFPARIVTRRYNGLAYL